MAVTSEFLAKYARYEDLMQARGVRRSTFDPPLFRGLRRIGVPAVPPYVLPFWKMAVIYGAVFAPCYCVGIWALGTLPGRAPGSLLIASLVSGVVFGLVMALWTRRFAKRLNLPRWEEI